MHYLIIRLYIIALSLCLMTCSSLPYGKITGELIGEKSKNPISEGIIIPFWVENNVRATAVTKLAAEVGDDGTFELTELPPGRYVLLYSTAEKTRTTSDTLNGLSIPLSLDSYLSSLHHFTQQGQSKANFKSNTSPPLSVLDDLLGDITLQTGSTFEYDSNSLLASGAGSLLFAKHGISVNYQDGKFLSIKIQSRQTVDVSIKAWGL